MAFQDADRFGFTINLPFRGKLYKIESPNYDTGMRITEQAAIAAKLSHLVDKGEQVPDDLMKQLVLDDEQELDHYARLLGESLEEMKADDCPLEFIKLAAATVTVWVLMDKAKAEEYWNSGGRPNLKRPADKKRKASRRTSAATTRPA